jgi:hypothetical protein
MAGWLMTGKTKELRRKWSEFHSGYITEVNLEENHEKL